MSATRLDFCLLTLTEVPESGYKAVFVSVDVPVLGRRLNEMRNNFILPEEMEFPNILSNGKDEFSGENEATAYGASDLTESEAHADLSRRYSELGDRHPMAKG